MLVLDVQDLVIQIVLQDAALIVLVAADHLAQDLVIVVLDAQVHVKADAIMHVKIIVEQIVRLDALDVLEFVDLVVNIVVMQHV